MARGSVHEGMGSGKGRQRQGLRLFEEGAFERISSDVFVVQAPTRTMGYTVDLEHMSCECMDYARHSYVARFRCQHLIATDLYREWLRRGARVMAPIFREAGAS